jgi:hypothetical protein
MPNPTSTALALMKERNIHVCQVCGERPAEEAHHMLYSKKKGITDLNLYENLCLVCRQCHHITGKAKTWEAKVAYWEWACNFYGRERMIAWHRELPLKVKERYEDIEL